MRKIVYILLLLSVLMASSCVSKKKYLLAENGRLEEIERGNRLKQMLLDCNEESDNRGTRLSALMQDTTDLGKSLRNYQSLLTSNLSEQEKLNALLNEKIQELDKRESTIVELQNMINEQNRKVQVIAFECKRCFIGIFER